MQRTRKARALKSEKAGLTIESLLRKIVRGKTLLKRRKGAKLFSQGEAADSIYFIQTGKAQLTVVSAHGKKAVLGMMGPSDFLGEECLVGDSRRKSTATVLSASTIFGIEKRAMLQDRKSTRLNSSHRCISYAVFCLKKKKKKKKIKIKKNRKKKKVIKIK